MADDKAEKTKAELQQELAAADQPVTGTKAELEERVEDLSRVHKPDVYVARVNR